MQLKPFPTDGMHLHCMTEYWWLTLSNSSLAHAEQLQYVDITSNHVIKMGLVSPYKIVQWT